MTIQTIVLIDTLVKLGADMNWSTCIIFSTQNQVNASIPAYALERMKEVVLNWFIEQTLYFEQDHQLINIILNDSGDLTKIVFEDFPELLSGINDISEVTTNDVHRLYKRDINGKLVLLAIKVNDSVVKSKHDNEYACQESTANSIRNTKVVMITGKVAVVTVNYDVNKCTTDSLRSAGSPVILKEINPICALQAAKDGFEEKHLTVAILYVQIIVAAKGDKDISQKECFKLVKNKAIICNIGHFDNKIDMVWLNSTHGNTKKVIKPKEDLYNIDCNQIILLTEGLLLNLVCSIGHPSFVISNRFTNQTLAQLELYLHSYEYVNKVFVLPKHLDKKVATLHLDKIGIEFEALRTDQADSIGVKPFNQNNKVIKPTIIIQ